MTEKSFKVTKFSHRFAIWGMRLSMRCHEHFVAMRCRQLFPRPAVPYSSLNIPMPAGVIAPRKG
jgi:hypothetical protein